jgi:hypothetical protein
MNFIEFIKIMAYNGIVRGGNFKMIEFFDADIHRGNASLYCNNITFSKNLIKYFSEAFKVRVGIDKNNKAIHVYPLNKDKALSGEFQESSLINISISKTYARVCSSALMNYICSIFGLEIGKKDFLRYNAAYDDIKKAVIINLGGLI